MLDKKSRLPVAIKDVVIVVAGVAIVWAIVWIWFGTNPFYVVSSGSMEPVLKQYDILVVRDGQSFDELKVGEIIVFHRPEGGDRVIVHRIVEIAEGRDGDRILRTKGDANPSSIPGTDFPISRDDYIGRVVYVIPGVGFITQAIAPPVNYIIIAIILAILFLNRMGKKNKPVEQEFTGGAAAGTATTTTTAASASSGEIMHTDPPVLDPVADRPSGTQEQNNPTGDGNTAGSNGNTSNNNVNTDRPATSVAEVNHQEQGRDKNDEVKD
ncbi:MAG TPA: signal peptidase I [Nitrososphaera sp.]|nr:signal peptidase I [Nitrososphaera sp.]